MTNFLSESASFAELIRQLEGLSVVVLGHRRPDGDCIGSQVALTRILRTMGINAIAVNNDPVPRTLQKFVGDTPFTNLKFWPTLKPSTEGILSFKKTPKSFEET